MSHGNEECRSISHRIVLVWACLAIVTAAAENMPADKAQPGAVVSTLTIRVTHEDGTPAVGVPIQTVSLERVGYTPQDDYVTDETGTVLVPFRRGDAYPFDGNISYGMYRFVIKPEDAVWEVSDTYVWNELPEGAEPSASGDYPWGVGGFPVYEDFVRWRRQPLPEGSGPSNRRIGELVPVRAGEPLTWEPVIHRGPAVRLVLQDQDGRPLPGIGLNVGYDLEKGSHTGLGGEVRMGHIQTGSDGSFLLENVGDYVYTFEEWHPLLYAPDLPWNDPRIRHFVLRDSPVVRVHRDRGRQLSIEVLDAATDAPVPDAELRSMNRYPGMLQDGTIGRTGPDGRFEARPVTDLESPPRDGTVGYIHTNHVDFVSIRNEGYAEARVDPNEFPDGATITVRLEREPQTNTD